MFEDVKNNLKNVELDVNILEKEAGDVSKWWKLIYDGCNSFDKGEHKKVIRLLEKAKFHCCL